MNGKEPSIEELWRAILELSTELKLIKKDIHWIKRVVQWVVIGIAAVLGVQIPAWL